MNNADEPMQSEQPEIFSETTGSVAEAVPCALATVRDYCDWNLIEHLRLPNGMRLLKPSAIEQIRQIRTVRLARRGGNHGRGAAA
jgi:DNA-binding transcriptional MerR regulator